MGDRANIAIQYQDGKRVYFYGHWSGEDYAHALQRALAKRWRWDDESYLARIIWDEFERQQGEETSYGIAPYAPDNEHPILVVDVAKQEIRTEGDGRGFLEVRVGLSWTFEQYLALADAGEAVENDPAESSA